MSGARAAPAALLASLSRALEREPDLLFAYAYGSILRRRDARDVDIAVYLRGRDDPWSRAQGVADRLAHAACGLPVDAHPLNRAEAAFAFQVLATGRLLLDRDREERLEWEAHLLSRYQDLKPMLDFHDRRFLGR